jgi:FkbM family methyltransferase
MSFSRVGPNQTIERGQFRLAKSITYTIRNGPLKGMKKKGGLGWLPFGHTETPEDIFWSGFNFTGKTIYDIGAFHGMLTLLFAPRASAVVAFEPNKENCRHLEENIALNGLRNVTVRAVALGSQVKTAYIASDPLFPGMSKISASGDEVLLSMLDKEVDSLPAPNVMKIDTEGFELEVLRGAKKLLSGVRPELFLEMHGGTIAEKRTKTAEILRFLWDNGYLEIRHVETGAFISPGCLTVPYQGHLLSRQLPMMLGAGPFMAATYPSRLVAAIWQGTSTDESLGPAPAARTSDRKDLG